MNEAETRAELIDPARKAAGWGIVDASRVSCEVITLNRLQGARKPSRHRGPNAPPSSHIHGQAIIRHPARNIRRLIEYIGDHPRRPGLPREPRAMQLDPAVGRAVYGRLRKPRVNLRVCSWSCSRIKRWSVELPTLEV
jgi:hypothetical protein